MEDEQDDSSSTPSEAARENIQLILTIEKEILVQINAQLKVEPKPSLQELLPLLSKIEDIVLTKHWTKKLEKAILKNPSLLTSPGAKAGSLLEKLRTFGTKIDKVQRGDGRGSGSKLKKASGDGVVDSPSDDSEPS